MDWKERVKDKAWESNVEGFEMLIHRSHEAPDTWFLTCFEMGIGRIKLGWNLTLEQADEYARKELLIRLKKFRKLEEKLIEEGKKVPF